MAHDTKPLPTPEETRTEPDALIESVSVALASNAPTSPGIGLDPSPTTPVASVEPAVTRPDRPRPPEKSEVLLAVTRPGPQEDSSWAKKTKPEGSARMLGQTDEVPIDDLLSGMGADDHRKKQRAPAPAAVEAGPPAASHGPAHPPAARVEKPEGLVQKNLTDPLPGVVRVVSSAAVEPLVDDRKTSPPTRVRAALGEMRGPALTLRIKPETTRPWWAFPAAFLAVLAIGGAVIWIWQTSAKPDAPAVDTNPTTPPPRIGEPKGPVPTGPTLEPAVVDPPRTAAPSARPSAAPIPPGAGRPSAKTSTTAPSASAPSSKATVNPDTLLFQPRP